MSFNYRFCNTPLEFPQIHMESMPLTDDFISINDKQRSEYQVDNDIYECGHCGLVQNPRDFNYEGYYRDYQYTSGHSEFVKLFMCSYATAIVETYLGLNGRLPQSVLEVGSGDGEQLLQFQQLGVGEQLGVEPSYILAKIALERGVDTIADLFSSSLLSKISNRFDLCISSYTLDHIGSPIEYLDVAYQLLNDGGLLAFEVHDLDKILSRSEYCLFEHEHTIYLNEKNLDNLLGISGFELVVINPLADSHVRANSLIVFAKKIVKLESAKIVRSNSLGKLLHADSQIISTIDSIDNWVRSLPVNTGLIGFGAGGRGVMTLASLRESNRFWGVFDSNFKSNQYLMPKSRVPIYGVDDLGNFSDCYCLVFSYGYIAEIMEALIAAGFDREKIYSLKSFYLG